MTTEVVKQVVMQPTFRGDHHPEKEKAQQTLGFRRAGEGT